MTETVRIGVLGAARIVPAALIRPSRSVAGAQVVAIAARDARRAASFAAKHGIGKVHGSYEALVADPEVDAIYNPLPNGLHARWTIAALEAGKHVLCEKPFTSNATEAAQVAKVAERSGKVVMEAFHYRYHPLAARMREIATGELGTIRHVETAMCFPLPVFSNIRYSWELGGGSLMDNGCYTVHLARLLGGGEPEVVSASAKLHTSDVDRAMTAELRFPGGHSGRITCSMWSSDVLKFSARVVGERGEMTVFNPFGPQFWHRLTVKTDGKARREQSSRRPTYEFQLEAFVSAVTRGTPILTPPSDSIANMTVIDNIYKAAGMRPRGT